VIGNGTPRFAVEVNALFGQWDYGGQGLRPEHQRGEFGEHRVASTDATGTTVFPVMARCPDPLTIQSGADRHY
jgi:hypothetical protein